MGILVVARSIPINLRYMFVCVTHPQTGAKYQEKVSCIQCDQICGVCGKASGSEGGKSAKKRVGMERVRERVGGVCTLMNVKASEKV